MRVRRQNQRSRQWAGEAVVRIAVILIAAGAVLGLVWWRTNPAFLLEQPVAGSEASVTTSAVEIQLSPEMVQKVAGWPGFFAEYGFTDSKIGCKVIRNTLMNWADDQRSLNFPGGQKFKMIFDQTVHTPRNKSLKDGRDTVQAVDALIASFPQQPCHAEYSE